MQRLDKKAELIARPREQLGLSSGVLRDIILGGQDGLVNVLGVVLGVAGATGQTRIVIITGLVATFAESISMGAVAYTSSKAAKSYYEGELAQEKEEIRTIPAQERKEIRDIYRAKGFKGQLLNRIVNHITSRKKLWLDTMMQEELKLSPEDYKNPAKDAIIVGLASVVGSVIPLLAFFFMPVKTGVIASLVISALFLFAVGAGKAKVTIGSWWKSGIELMLIGMLAALAGYGLGAWLGGVV
ncbi:VIT1/CCC1 transporter family protein [Candidatus Woesearchaeota archaeon]|nr:VIT1/CCC1 transporter family protein [Candidatus Woesearchaeota archaeon]